MFIRLRFPVIMVLSFLIFIFCAIASAELSILRVGYVSSPGYLLRDDFNDYSGSLFEHVEMIASYAGLRPVYIQVSPSEMKKALDRGDIDAFVGIISPDVYEADGFDFMSRDTGSTPVYIARPYGSAPMRDSVTIGYLDPVYSVAINCPPNPMTEEAFKGMTFIPFQTEEELHAAYNSGIISGYLTSDYFFDDTVPVERNLFISNMYIGVKKGNRALLSRLNSAMETALAIYPQFRAEIDSGHSATNYPLVFSRNEQDYLETHPVIRVATIGDQEPFTYFENGEAKGVVRDILTLMGKDLGVKFDIVEAKNNAVIMRELKSGSIDAAAAFSANYNRAHEVNALLTSSYLMLNYVPVMRRREELTDDPRIVCPRQHFFVEEYVSRRFPPDKIVYRDNYSDCFEAVSRGEADILIAKALTVQHEIESGDYANLFSSGQTLTTQRIAMAVSETSDPMLLKILNKEIAHLDKNRIQGIVGKYMEEIHTQRSWRAYLYENPLRALFILGGIASAVIGILAYILESRRRANRRLFEAAYVNPLTGIRSVIWFEKFVPSIIRRKHSEELAAGSLFIMSIQTRRFALIKATYKDDALYTGISDLFRHMRENNPWILANSISSELSQMFLLCRLDDGMTMNSAAEKFIADSSEIQGGGSSIRMEYHIGLCAMQPEDGSDSVARCMNRAALAMSEAIFAGETIGVYDEKIQERRALEKKIEDLMYKALENEEFKVWLQPKYDLRTRRVIGAEALVRWQSPELGFMMPGKFIDLFEKNGFVIPFDYYMLEHVCRLQKARADAGKTIVPIAVNQSGLHMKEADYLSHMREMKELYNLPNGAVELELTETAFIDFDTKEESASSEKIVSSLRDMGYAIAMDDFCTGYSSIAMLQRLPMDIMKIDRSMLLASENSPRGQKILKNVVGFGQSLDMLVLCEGIETAEQEALLLRNDCTYGQGFLFARPMPGEDFEKFIEEHKSA